MSDEETRIETKVCNKCNVEKNITEFQFRKENNKYRNDCKKCAYEVKKIYTNENDDKIKEKRKTNYQNKKEKNKNSNFEQILNLKTKKCTQCKIEKRCNIDLNYSDFYFNKNEGAYQYKCISCITENKKNKYDDNKDHFRYIQKKSIAKFTEEQKAEIKAYQKEYRANNKDILQKQQNEWKVNKRKSDSSYNLRNNVSRMIAMNLKNNNGSKNGSSIMDYLPYSIEELKTHIEFQWEDWMSWDNHGPVSLTNKTWQIDHIIPQSKLPYDSMEHFNFLKCWAFANLRPLDAIENSLKKDKISDELFNDTMIKINLEINERFKVGCEFNNQEQLKKVG